ncbi:TetR-like C-terminal domain-containing protein [Spirillospora sp. NPDC048911]|uniref:TetR-like C-terminal domain-containing protein n=1 Tax=Spirillospora sp. NPDC048911 TaxID=3364527 RepID=UPI0037109936
MSPETRRRGSALEAAIYAAVLEQLEAVGFRKLTMEGVAAAAQTGKAALYRRWDGKEELVRDALLHALPSPEDIAEQDDIRSDLMELLGHYANMINSTSGAVFQVLKEEGPESTGLLHTAIRERVSGPLKILLHRALERGVERGDVRPEAATREIALVGPSMFMYQCVVEKPQISEEFLRMVVEDVMLPIVRPDESRG